MRSLLLSIAAMTALAGNSASANAAEDEIGALSADMVKVFDQPRPVRLIALSPGAHEGPFTTINAMAAHEGCWTSMGVKSDRVALGYIIDWQTTLGVDLEGATLTVRQNPQVSWQSISWQMPSPAAAQALAVKARRLWELCRAKAPT